MHSARCLHPYTVGLTLVAAVNTSLLPVSALSCGASRKREVSRQRQTKPHKNRTQDTTNTTVIPGPRTPTVFIGNPFLRRRPLASSAQHSPALQQQYRMIIAQLPLVYCESRRSTHKFTTMSGQWTTPHSEVSQSLGGGVRDSLRRLALNRVR